MLRRLVRDDLQDIGDAIAWADGIGQAAGAPARVREDLQVCLEEALANLVLHGRADGDKAIALEIAADDRSARIRITDRCAPFNVETVDVVAAEAKTGGNGLKLLRAFAPDIRYASVDGLNALTFSLGDAALSLIRRIPAFEDVPDEDLRAFFKAATVKSFVAGETLLKQGAESTAAFILLDGEVSVIVERAGGAHPVATLRAPALIGEIGALADLPRTASVRAVTSVRLLSAPRAALREAFANAPDALSAIIRQLGGQIRNVNTVLGLYAEGFAALEKGQLDDELEHDLGNMSGDLADFADAFARLARRIAQERRLRADMASAALIQREMLPRGIDERLRARSDIFGDMKPAKDVGGDFYDVVALDGDRVALCVGDVCGKGVPASLFMCVTVTTLRLMARENMPLGEMMEKVNNSLYAQNPASMFATVFFAVLDLNTGAFAYVNCGHDAPFLLRANGLSTLETGRSPLAMFPGKTWPVHELTLAPGDTIFLYTDGITEAFDVHGAEYGEKRLRAALERVETREAEPLVASIIADVQAFAKGAEQADDITCLALSLR